MSIPDVCLILEGTYPYVTGGVANWAHDLIQRQSHLKFHLICLQPPYARLKQVYKLPDNVVGFDTIYLQELAEGDDIVKAEEVEAFFSKIELPLLKLQHFGHLSDLKSILTLIKAYPQKLGSKILIDSEEAWNMTLRMYRATMGESSFLNFYFSWKGLMASFYSILLCKLPLCRIYHAVSTGYAGLLLARAKLETEKPCIITEHGIYTNERRIEITLADWLYDQRTMSLSIDPSIYDRDLKDFWIDTFYGYSKLCYEASDLIITLYKGNQEYQIADGADPKKMCIIPNGVDFNKFASLDGISGHAPTIALIGRVVPIKDIKTFIHAVSMIKEVLPNIQAYIIGPTDEDPDYYKECLELAHNLHLTEHLRFTGKADIRHYLPKIDLLVLTSISESQPLIILEGGAAGIPCVATDAGSCPELIYGKEDESPPIGPAGAISPLANPSSIATQSIRLLTDKNYYEACRRNIQERVMKYYNLSDIEKVYKSLYETLATGKKWQE